ncbi:MAG: hypothetical protein LBP73_04365, partial [Clostridiales Family XIII bacterium]|nr:hypothetical protein [Clostridiales Family XIII bacterium]
LKTPASGGYVKVDAAKYRLGDAGIAFDKSLFGEAGAYSFVFHASGSANKSASLTVKREAAELSLLTKAPAIGLDLTFKCEDADFWNGATVYVRPKDGEPSMIPSSRLYRARTGELTLKADYFASPSCPVKEAGAYVFTFTNSRFEPASLEIEVTLDAAPAG